MVQNVFFIHETFCLTGLQIDWDVPVQTESTEIDFDISGITLESGGTDEGQVRNIKLMSL